MNGPVVWVEGLIGSGKTTLTQIIADELGFRPIFEPVDDNPLLGRFYENPKKYAFPMQMWLMARRHAMQQLAAWEAAYGEAAGAVIDRGLPGDRVFCKMHVEEGNIEPEFWEVYQYFYDVMSLNLPVPSLLVYLDVEPEIAFERMKSRGREEESGVPLEYLKKLRRGYLDLLVEIESGKHSWSRGMKVARFPWNTDFVDPSTVTKEIVHICKIDDGGS